MALSAEALLGGGNLTNGKEDLSLYMLAVKTQKQAGRVHFYCDQEDRDYLKWQLTSARKDHDHAFFVLGSNMDEIETGEPQEMSCDFINIFTHAEEDGGSITESKSGYATVELFLTETTIDCLLERLNAPHPTGEIPLRNSGIVLKISSV